MDAAVREVEEVVDCMSREGEGRVFRDITDEEFGVGDGGSVGGGNNSYGGSGEIRKKWKISNCSCHVVRGVFRREDTVEEGRRDFWIYTSIDLNIYINVYEYYLQRTKGSKHASRSLSFA